MLTHRLFLEENAKTDNVVTSGQKGQATEPGRFSTHFELLAFSYHVHFLTFQFKRRSLADNPTSLSMEAGGLELESGFGVSSPHTVVSF